MNIKIGMSERGFLGFMSVMIWVGIYLTGFDSVHWLLYIPGAATAIGAITGMCPGMGLMRKVLGG